MVGHDKETKSVVWVTYPAANNSVDVMLTYLYLYAKFYTTVLDIFISILFINRLVEKQPGMMQAHPRPFFLLSLFFKQKKSTKKIHFFSQLAN